MKSKTAVLVTYSANECSWIFLFLQMNQDSEKWPAFQQSPSSSKAGSESRKLSPVGHRVSGPYLMEETDSGMFTLRKKDKEAPRVQLIESGLIDGAQTS